MFVSHDINSNKKKFLKPNILRRKSNTNKASTVKKDHNSVAYQSPNVRSILASSFVLDQKDQNLDKIKSANGKTNKTCQNPKKPVNRLKEDITQGQFGNIQETVFNVTTDNMICIDNSNTANIIEVDQNQSFNVESFLLDSEVNSYIFENNATIVKDDQDGNLYFEQKSDVTNTMVPLAAVSSIHEKRSINLEDFTISLSAKKNKDNDYPTITMTPLPLMSLEDTNSIHDYTSMETQSLIVTPIEEAGNEQELPVMTPVKMSMEQLTRSPEKYKCDIDDCKKEFKSEQKLKKHKRTHNKTSGPKIPRQTTAECPVKKIVDGIEEACGKVFRVRDDLIKHLNEDHTSEDAVYRCTECSRSFFFAVGLRVHARSHVARTSSLACPWPGCSRVFRQPCRLKEHARAHTGDKPYSCRHPNCGWSFRTASKLVRHARRHTGDRRHVCAACGRAFLRREHLRDHAARHHASARRLHYCPHTDCQQTFTNMSSLYMHMKKVHKNEEEHQNTTPIENHEQTEDVEKSDDNMFMVNVLEVEDAGVADVGAVPGVVEGVTEGAEGQWQCARTHCTWPLPPRRHDAFVLEEDAQVEQSESSESNIYTVRSDLFLHGNVLHNEDSEQMGRCVRVSEAEGDGALALDTDLLLDAPSVHLDQEELYTDPVDESAFRVFLLNGEELAYPKLDGGPLNEAL